MKMIPFFSCLIILSNLCSGNHHHPLLRGLNQTQYLHQTGRIDLSNTHPGLYLASIHIPSSQCLFEQLSKQLINLPSISSIHPHINSAGEFHISISSPVDLSHFHRIKHITGVEEHHRLHPDVLPSQNVVIHFVNSSKSIGSFSTELLQNVNVMYIEPHHVDFSTFNMHAKQATQGTKPSMNIFWANELKGQSQIIAQGDSGVDYDMCFFRDPLRPVPVDKIDLQHRKIVTFRKLFDTIGKDLHGTHTAGTLAGNVFSDDPDVQKALTPFNGMAPEAKLAVYDLGKDGVISIGNSMYDTYLKVQYTDTDARISSNSWGAVTTMYDNPSLDADTFQFDHKDFLLVFAAGNFGVGHPYSRISTPGQSKNALTVGAASNAPNYFIDSGINAGITFRSDNLEVKLKLLVRNVFQPLSSNAGTNLNVIKWTCTADNNALSTDSVVLIVFDSSESSCSPSNVIKQAQTDGAKLILFYNVPLSVPIATYLFPQLFTPVCMMKLDDTPVIEALASGAVADFPVPFTEFGTNAVAGYSSKGPTVDGRIKPDVVGPGHAIVSAKSDMSLTTNNCFGTQSLQAREGTSMAAPVIAGHAALIRQYFMEGFYPSGSRVSSDAFTPPAALIKAVVIASSQTLGSDKYTEGFGYVNLSSVMHFSPQSTLPLPNALSVHSGSLETGRYDMRCYRTTDNEFKATLVWTDPPSAITATAHLVNNLDLTVHSGTGYYIGNVGLSRVGDTLLFDDLNNVEQVIVSDIGEVAVVVHGANVPRGPQDYSLVVTGYDEEIECSSNPLSCPNGCSGRGQCRDGVCSCSAGYFGYDCSVQPTGLGEGSSGKFTLQSGTWTYFRVDAVGSDVFVILKRYEGHLELVVDEYPLFPTLYSHRTFDDGDVTVYPVRSWTLYGGGNFTVGVFSYCCSVGVGEVQVTFTDPRLHGLYLVGIVIGVVVGLAGLIFVCFLCWNNSVSEPARERTGFTPLPSPAVDVVEMGDVEARL